MGEVLSVAMWVRREERWLWLLKGVLVGLLLDGLAHGSLSATGIAQLLEVLR